MDLSGARPVGYGSDVPPKLDASEETVKVEIRMPVSLRQHAAELAKAEGDGDLSSWFRGLVRKEWKRYNEGRRPGKGSR